MIANPKYAPSLSDHAQLYLLYIHQQVELITGDDFTFDVFVDTLYNLGQCKQEMFYDDDLSPSDWAWLNDCIDNVIYSVKKSGGFS